MKRILDLIWDLSLRRYLAVTPAHLPPHLPAAEGRQP